MAHLLLFFQCRQQKSVGVYGYIVLKNSVENILEPEDAEDSEQEGRPPTNTIVDDDYELCTKDDNHNQYSISNVHFAVDDDGNSDPEQVRGESKVCMEAPEDGDAPTEHPGKIQEYPEECNNGLGVHTYIDGSRTDGGRSREDFIDVTEQTGEEEPLDQTQLPYEAFQIKERRKTSKEEYEKFKSPSRKTSSDRSRKTSGERSRKTSSERFRKTSSERFRRLSSEQSEESRRLFESSDEDDENIFPL